jgi:acetyl-CoA carboxylase carboxyl transferase subunit alpha
MKITAQDLKQLGIIDGIIAEPVGGAHRGPQAVMTATAATIRDAMAELVPLDGPTLRRQRREKFLAIGRNLA